MPTIAKFHCWVQIPMAKVSMPSCAAQRRPEGIFVGSPESETTVTNVTAFSAMLRAKKNQETAPSATFHASSGNSQHAASSTTSTNAEEISDHSQAFAFSMLSRPRGHVSAIHSAEPSDISDFG